jgi:hypothetical protein
MASIDDNLQDRLKAVKDSVRKATEQALKDAAGESEMELRFIDTGENNDPNNDNNSESFALGMTLFGKDVSSVEREMRDKLNRVEAELKDVVIALQSREGEEAGEEDDDESADDPESLQAEAEMLTSRIHFLRECSSARSLLDEATMMSSSAMPNEPDFVESARLLAKAQVALQKAQDVVSAEEERSTEPTPALVGAYRIVDAIRDPIRRKRVELLSKASALLESSVTLTSESITVRGGRMGPGQLQQAQGLHAAYDILEALSSEHGQRLHDVIRRLTDQLFNVVIKPQLDAHKEGVSAVKPWAFQEISDGTRGLTGRVTLTKTPTHTLEWKQAPDATSDVTPSSGSPEEQSIQTWQETFKFVHQVMAFVEERILLQRTTLCEFVGQRLFGKPSDAPANSLNLEAFGLESSLLGDDKGLFVKPSVQLLWDTCIPSHLESADRLDALARKLRDSTDNFEREMQQRHFLPPTGYHPLSDFASNFESKYVEKRRCTLLNGARNVLLNTDYHNTVEVGVDVKPASDDVLDEKDGMAVFKLHKSSVSQTSSKIMSLCRSTMDEAVSVQFDSPSSPLALLPATLYRTCREMLDLFRAIIPATHGGEVASIPRTAAVLHNDCVFLAQHCLTLGLEYKDKFPVAAGTEDTRGQLLPQTCMFVDMVPPFRELADRSMSDMLERQKGQLWEIVGTRITLLSESLRSNESLAEWSEAETALKAGLYHLSHLSQAWKPILSQEVFGRSMGYLCDTIFTMYTDQVMKGTAISEPACQFVSVLFRTAMTGVSDILGQNTKLCRTWDRFSAIGRFMDMSLSDIQKALSEGVFRSVTGPELSRLIVATFDESQKRDHLLHVLASHN